MAQISIKQIKKIREELGFHTVIIYGISDDGFTHVLTHGKGKRESDFAAHMGNEIKRSVGFPDRFCNENPIPRICKNCSFWKKYAIAADEPEFNEPGLCFQSPMEIEKNDSDTCGQFDPKY